MRRSGWLQILLACGIAATAMWASAALEPWTVVLKHGERIVGITLTRAGVTVARGSVAYQGPMFDSSDPNWKPAVAYEGVPIRDLIEMVGGMVDGDTVAVVSADGYAKRLPYSVIYGETPAGTAMLALDWGEEGSEDAPMLVFLPEDEAFSNDDMLASLGEANAHYFGDRPSTMGLMVKGVTYLIVNYDGGALPELGSVQVGAVESEGVEGAAIVTVVRGEGAMIFDLDGIEALDAVTGPGTYTDSTGVDTTATYTGVPMATLLGNVPEDATVRVTASDGYSMNYVAGMFLDRSEGTWVLAYKENGIYMPFDPGYFRIVQIGDDNPHFSSSLSARMVERIEVLGEYEPYTLTLIGAATRVFDRGELERGIGCPCHTATVTSTFKGAAASYSGLPLWRLIGYVDDAVFPSAELGIHYNDGDFNEALAAGDYTITLVAADGYTQTVLSSWIAGDDRFIVAFKCDGSFLGPATDGAMRFTFDDSVEFTEGMTPRPVKFLVEIRLGF